MRIALLTAVALLATACERALRQPPKRLPASEEEARAVAEHFIAAAGPCDPDRLGPIYDGHYLFHRAVLKAPVDKALKRELVAAVSKRAVPLGEQLCNGFGEEASFELLRMRRHGDGYRPLVRMIGGGTFNYYELELGKPTETGEVRIIDQLDYYSGDQLSDIVAEGMGLGVKAAEQGDRLDMKELIAARAADDWAKVRELVHEMPTELRKSHMFRLAELQAAMRLEDPTYVELLASFEKDFPDDPAMMMLVLDRHAMEENGEAMLEGVERLDRRVGGDPYLDAMRANAYLMDPTPANLARAEERARAAIAGIPHVMDAWWTLVTVQLEREDFAGVVASFDDIEKRFEFSVEREALATDQIYERLLASPEFEAWWAKQQPPP